MQRRRRVQAESETERKSIFLLNFCYFWHSSSFSLKVKQGRTSAAAPRAGGGGRGVSALRGCVVAGWRGLKVVLSLTLSIHDTDISKQTRVGLSPILAIVS